MRTGLPALVIVLTVAFFGVPALLCGDRASAGPGEAREVVVSGKLTGYAKNHVEVDGKRIRLCKDATILDPEENPITVTGLCATETVQVTLGGSCATTVQALILRR